MVEEAGRARDSVAVQVEGELSHVPLDRFNTGEHLAALAELASAGVTSFVVRPDASSIAASVDCLAHYGEEVIAASR